MKLKHEVTLTFILGEEVTPRIFAEKIAFACARGGAIRVGERVCVDENGTPYLYEYTGDNGSLDLGPTKIENIPTVELIHP